MSFTPIELETLCRSQGVSVSRPLPFIEKVGPAMRGMTQRLADWTPFTAKAIRAGSATERARRQAGYTTLLLGVLGMAVIFLGIAALSKTFPFAPASPVKKARQGTQARKPSQVKAARLAAQPTPQKTARVLYALPSVEPCTDSSSEGCTAWEDGSPELGNPDVPTPPEETSDSSLLVLLEKDRETGQLYAAVKLEQDGLGPRHVTIYSAEGEELEKPAMKEGALERFALTNRRSRTVLDVKVNDEYVARNVQCDLQTHRRRRVSYLLPSPEVPIVE